MARVLLVPREAGAPPLSPLPHFSNFLPDRLADLLEGRDAEAAVRRIGDDDEDMLAHAWFAMAVRAAHLGDRAGAARLFRKAADRAPDRDFPYGLAIKMAEKYER